MTTVTIAANAVTAKLIGADKKAKLLISQTLSYQVAGAEMMTAFKRGTWDGRNSMFSFSSCTFPAGFVSHVNKVLIHAGYETSLIRRPPPKPRGLSVDKCKVNKFPESERYWYQRETVKRLERHRQIVAQISTGGGKSEIAKYAYMRFKLPTLFVTTRGILMYQMRDQFEKDLGVKVGVIGDGEFSPTSGFNVAMIQTLAQHIEPMTVKKEIERIVTNEQASDQRKIDKFAKSLQAQKVPIMQRAKRREQYKADLMKARKSPKVIQASVMKKVKLHMARRKVMLEFLGSINLLILEEAHEASGDSYFKVTRACKKADYRLSLTATPFMKEHDEDNFRLMACSGPVAIKVTEKELIDCGILSTPYFKFVKTVKPKKLYRGTPWKRAYKIGITESFERNAQIVAEALRGVNHGLSVMIFIKHKKHGEQLLRDLKSTVHGKTKVSLIYGDHNQIERRAALETLKKPNIVIGSTIIDVGVDVPAIGMAILAGGGKAEVAMRQRIGRVLRSKPTGANVSFIVDFTDHDNITLKKHADQRRAIVENTPGFAENVVLELNFKLLKVTI